VNGWWATEPFPFKRHSEKAMLKQRIIQSAFMSKSRYLDEASVPWHGNQQRNGTRKPIAA